jgi:hypothetical protein
MSDRSTIEPNADLAHELQKIYDAEINVRIGWFWDSGLEIRLGDSKNEYVAEENVPTTVAQPFKAWRPTR